MDFLNLPGAIQEGVANNPLTEAEIKAAFDKQQIADQAALTIVLNDVRIAEQYIQSKNLAAEWNACDDTYRAYVQTQTWPGDPTKQRANLPMPVVLEAVESLIPQAHMAFFSDPQPFLLAAKGRTDPSAARAMSKVECWATKVSGFEEEIRKMLKSDFVYGQSVGKYGWKRTKQQKKTYKNVNGEAKMTLQETEISQPTFEWVDLRNILVDPATRSHNIQDAGYVVHQSFINPEELDALRDDYENVPTRQELAQILATQLATASADSFVGIKYKTWRENQAELQNIATSADPLRQPLEILERWTDGRVITILERCIVLRNEPNEYGKKPFCSCAFIDVLNAFFGFGVAKLLAGEQAFQTGVASSYVDTLNLTLFPFFIREEGNATQSQTIKIAPGKVVNDKLTPVSIPDGAANTALTAIGASEQRAGRRVGSNFGPEMPTQAMRTAEGVQAFTSGVQVRLQYFIENFADMVYIPVLEAFIDLCKDNLTPDQIKQILSDEDAQAYQGDVMEIYNGTYAVDVLTSTKLASKRAAAQLFVPITQMIGQPATATLLGVQCKKVDFVEFLGQASDITGWPLSDIIVDMTDEDKQRQAASNPALVNAQAKQGQMQQQQQNALELIQAKGEATAGNSVVKHILKANEPPPPAKPLANQ